MSSSTGKVSPWRSQTSVLSLRAATLASSEVTVTGVDSEREPLRIASSRTAKVISFVMLAGGLTESALSSKRTAPVAASVAIAPL